MAVNWETQIVVTNREQKRVRITGIRTDDSVEPPDVRTYSVDGQVDPADLQASLRKIVDCVFAAHTAAVASEQANAALVEGWEDSAAAYLNSLET
jgi:hypothetical protein